SNGDSDRPPALPARLKPPTAPAIEKIQTAAAEEPVAAGAEESGADQPANSVNAGPAKVNDRSQGVEDAHIVQIKRSQTTFEIARTYLGQSNWKEVDQIRALNPQIRSGYQLLPAGTRIVLPGPDPNRGKAGKLANQKTGNDTNSSAERVSFTGKSNMVRVHR